MIQFSCSACGKEFSVADEYAGRRGTCKQCGAVMIVPAIGAPAAEKIRVTIPPVPVVATIQDPISIADKSPSAIPPRRRSTVRARRLEADAAQVRAAFSGSSRVQVKSMVGDPPEIYQIQYRIKGLVRGPSGQPVVREQHVAEITLTRDYPRQSPRCKMLTPIFHPNIEPAMICVGDHWTAGERLVDLIVRIGEMITFQAYNIKSPLDGEAAMWADINSRHLPIDRCNLQPAEAD